MQDVFWSQRAFERRRRPGRVILAFNCAETDADSDVAQTNRATRRARVFTTLNLYSYHAAGYVRIDVSLFDVSSVQWKSLYAPLSSIIVFIYPPIRYVFLIRSSSLNLTNNRE